MSEGILNQFEILEPPKRTATLRGEVVDLSFIPARSTLKFVDFSKKYNVKKLEGITEGSFDPGMMEDILELVGTICQSSNPKITKDWLYDNLSIVDLVKFIQFVFAGMTRLKPEEGEGEDGKNLKSGT
jgi:hypothetical protein